MSFASAGGVTVALLCSGCPESTTTGAATLGEVVDDHEGRGWTVDLASCEVSCPACAASRSR